MKRSTSISLSIIVGIWVLSWLFARDIIRGLEQMGVLQRRGLVFTDASDFAFSLMVLAALLGGWAIGRVFTSLGRRGDPIPVVAEEDPRYRELVRQKDQLVRDLKELEFDRDLRKISEDDHEELARRLRDQATRILEALDELDPVQIYGDRIRADLEAYLGDASESKPEPRPSSEWEREVLQRPLYQELAPLLGERDLLLASLRNYWIESADFDRSDPLASVVTVADKGKGQRFTCTLAELRSRVLEQLDEGDEDETMRLARLAGLEIEREKETVRFAVAGEPQECKMSELRPKVLRLLSEEMLGERGAAA